MWCVLLSRICSIFFDDIAVYVMCNYRNLIIKKLGAYIYHFQSMKKFLKNKCIEVLYPKLKEKFQYPVYSNVLRCCHFILWSLLLQL